MSTDSTNLTFENVSDPNFAKLEGRIGSSPQSNTADTASGAMPSHPSTLDEPVSVTVLRDVKAVFEKLKHVFIPTRSRLLLKEWDLWGPLVLCTILSILLHDAPDDYDGGKKGSATGPEFAEVFFVYWAGAAMCTLNFRLVGAPVSFFQSLCVLGYCTLPHLAAAILCKVILYTTSNAIPMLLLRLVTVIASSGWATHASTAFLGSYMPTDRRVLCIYPLFLFYTFLGWLILSHNPYTAQAGHW